MRKLFLLLVFIALMLITGYYYYLPIVRWQKTAQSAGGFPYQIGLTKTRQIQCTPSCCTPVCSCCIGTGATLCSTKDAATCSTYSEINGVQSGGMGTMALFSQAQTSKAGYKPGDSIIAGGMTMTEMTNGVLASPGGCFGCGLGKTDSNVLERIAGVVKYIIAGKKE
jgi:hypothetical protein